LLAATAIAGMAETRISRKTAREISGGMRALLESERE
jgi:hypothetical protein